MSTERCRNVVGLNYLGQNMKNRTETICRVATALVVAMAVGGTFVGSSLADDKKPPFLEAYASFEVENDWTYDSDDPDSELNDLYATVEPTLIMHITDGLSLTTHGVLEPVRDPKPGEDRYFEDEGFYIQDLFLNYDWNNLSVLGGKFTPNFGRAWDIAPGVYGTDFAEDYELAERIGLGASYAFEAGGFGTHTLSASTFFVDTSILSESAIKNRGRTRREDGGPGNTESLESFAVAIDGGDFPETLFGDTFPGQSPVKGLTYQLAFVSQAAGEGSDSRENGLVASVAHQFPIGQMVKLEPLVEYAYFFDADGVDGQDRYYVTAGATALIHENWNVAMSYTRRETMPSGGADVGDNLFQVSAGYAFDFGLGVDVGWRYAEESDIESQTVGFLLTYCLNCPDE